MLEELKKEVYEANMELPRRGLSPIHGEMSAELTGKRDCLLSNPAVWITIS